MVSRRLCTVLALLLVCGGALHAAECRLSLALGLDVSGSVDDREYALQRQGLAAALRDPEVAAALLSMPAAPVEIMVYEWSGPTPVRTLLPFTSITDHATLDAAASRLATTARTAQPPSTALGLAMRHGIAALAPRPCWKRTLDISGDGTSNEGPRPAPERSRAEAAGVTINALVIGADAPATGDARYVEIGELVAYFSANVIAGPEAFVETALGFEEYEAAMIRKLKREIEGLTLSRR